MANRISSAGAGKIARRVISIVAVLGILAFAGCSSSEPSRAEQRALAKVELHFDINKCQPIEPGLYKCPASDKAICNPDYNGQADCVRIGPKGSVFVQGAGD